MEFAIEIWPGDGVDRSSERVEREVILRDLVDLGSRVDKDHHEKQGANNFAD